MILIFMIVALALFVVLAKADKIWNYKVVSINDTDLILTKGPFHKKQIHYKKRPAVSKSSRKPLILSNEFMLATDGWLTESGKSPDWYKLYDALDNLQKVLNLEHEIKELWSKK